MKKIKLTLLILTLLMFVSASLYAQAPKLGRKIFENGKYPQAAGNSGKIAFTHYTLENNVPKFEYVVGDPQTGKFENYGLEFQKAPPLGTIAWSHKGDRVAVVRKDLTTCDIYEYTPDKAELVRKLTDLTPFIPDLDSAYMNAMKLEPKGLLEVANMDWSYDDKFIAFSMIKVQNGSICILDVDSGTVRQVSAERFGTTPGWSPDGRYIYTAAFMENNGKVTQDIYRLKLEDYSTEKVITTLAQEMFPKIHPSGKYMLYTRMDTGKPQTLYVYDLAGGKSAQLVYLGENQTASFPNWSADGKSVIYQLVSSGKTFPDIYMIDFDPSILK